MEKLIRNSIVGVLLILITGCGSTNKTVAPSAKSKALDEMVDSKHFKADIQWAKPLMTSSMNTVMTSGLGPPGSMVSQINVMGSGFYFKMKGDTVSADLPYYGERQMGGGYDSNKGIKFEGKPKELEISKDEDKQRYQINFTISENSETYGVRLTLTPNLNAWLNISSSQRFSIRYEGKLSALEEADL
jgi:hypothetical protein